MPKSNIDWARVEQEIRKSVRYGNNANYDVFAKAAEADPERYSKLHKRIKTEEQDALRKGFR